MDEIPGAGNPIEGVAESGKTTGVEVETVDDSEEFPGELIVTPFDPDRIDVTTRSPTVDLLLSRIRSRAIDLAPDFQRKAGIWDDKRKSRLIESLLLRIPLPTFYAAENDDEEWAIVDGIQRLTAITQFMAPELLGEPPLHLRSLEYLGNEYNGLTYVDLPARLQLRLRETEFVLHLIRRGTPEPVKFNIFARINTGGLRLSAQELRHALVGGPIRRRLERMAHSDEFQSATSCSVRDDRMADREMVLRYLAFREIDPLSYAAQDFDGFLTESMRRLSDLPEERFALIEREFGEVMQCCEATFGQLAFRKVHAPNGYRSPINRALFEAVSVGVAGLNSMERDRLSARGSAAIGEIILLMQDYRFFGAISSGTGDVGKVRYRFEKMAEMLRRLADD